MALAYVEIKSCKIPSKIAQNLSFLPVLVQLPGSFLRTLAIFSYEYSTFGYVFREKISYPIKNPLVFLRNRLGSYKFFQKM